MRLWHLLAAALAVGATPSAALAYDVAASGTIIRLYASPAGNYSFRVTLSSPFTGCTNGFAYVNTTDANYQGYVSLLTTAFAMGKPVIVWANLVGGNFCELRDVQLNY